MHGRYTFPCLAAVVALLATRGECVTCDRVNSEPCQCTFKDSDGNLGLIDIRDYFEYPTTPTPDDDKYTYKFNCENFQCPNRPHPKAVACQFIKTQKVDAGLGKVNENTTWEINDLSEDKFQFVVTYHNGEGGRVTQVKFTYADSDMAMKVASEGNNQYNMEVTGKLVKRSNSPTSSPTSSPSKKGGGGGGTIAGPIGIVIIILFIGGFIT